MTKTLFIRAKSAHLVVRCTVIRADREPSFLIDSEIDFKFRQTFSLHVIHPASGLYAFLLLPEGGFNFFLRRNPAKDHEFWWKGSVK
jgi:hypothetical protein